jgi:phospholipid transport system transporter-binding protein
VATDAVFVRESGERYRLEAPLRFGTVGTVRSLGLELIGAAGAELTFDLSAVPAADSAGLALLIDWLAQARARRTKLHYAKPPEALRALARLSDVEPLIDA